jgi:hypothetical protein
MFPSLVGLLGFRSASISSPRASRKSPRRAYRPAFELLEARDVPSVSTLRQSILGEGASARVHKVQIELVSSPWGVQQQGAVGVNGATLTRSQANAAPQLPLSGQTPSLTGSAQPPVLANIGGLVGLSKEELLEKIDQYNKLIKALENAGADDAGELKGLRENLGKALDALLDLLHNR